MGKSVLSSFRGDFGSAYRSYSNYELEVVLNFKRSATNGKLVTIKTSKFKLCFDTNPPVDRFNMTKKSCVCAFSYLIY